MDYIAIDFETHLISKDSIFPKPVCVSSYDGGDAKLYRGVQIEPFLLSILENKELTIIAHHAVFECGVIYFWFPRLRTVLFDALDSGRIICTKINETISNVIREKPKYRFSLADLVKDYFDLDISATKTEDSWRLRYSELEYVETWPQEAIKYALDDSIYAHKLYMAQPKCDYLLSVQSAIYLNIMAAKGISIDTDRVELLESEVMAFLNPYYEFLIEKGLCVKTEEGKVKKETKKLKEYIQESGVELRFTAKGSISVEAESLEFYLNQKEDEIIKAFSSIAEYEKVITAYTANMKETPLFTEYSAVKNTGRTSSSKSKLYPSMNVQQMPRQVKRVSYDVRNCFIPDEGHKILSIDYAGLELASTAHQLYTVYKKSAMRDTLNSGDKPTDMHSKLAARIKGISYDEFMLHKKDYKDIRQLAKPINLGFPGGIGYDTMRHQLWSDGIKTRFIVLHKDKSKRNISNLYFKLRGEFPSIRVARLNKVEWALVDDELVKLKRDFFDLYPELETFLKETHKKYITGKSKWVKNEFDEWEEEPMYKYSVYGFKRDWCTYTAFCNGFLMQSPSAAGAKRAVNEVMRRFHDHPDLRPLAFIHDEILFSVNEDRVDLIDEAANIMIDEMHVVLSSVRITVEASLSDFWQKADGFWNKQYFKEALC